VSDRWLWVTAFSFVLGFLILFHLYDYGKNWEWETLTYYNLWTLSGTVRNLFFNGFRSVFPWSGLIFVGIWLGRQNVQDPVVRQRILLYSGAVTVLAELISRLLIAYFTTHSHGMNEETVKELFGTGSMPPLPLFLLASGGSAVVVIMCSIIFVEKFSNNFFVKAMVATGQLALTWYVGHIFICLLPVMLLNLSNTTSLPIAISSAIACFTAAALFSALWKQYYKINQGPLEWLMRKFAS
jgi:uncharacterized membrane protein YeiB